VAAVGRCLGARRLVALLSLGLQGDGPTVRVKKSKDAEDKDGQKYAHNDADGGVRVLHGRPIELSCADGWAGRRRRATDDAAEASGNEVPNRDEARLSRCQRRRIGLPSGPEGPGVIRG